MIFVCRFTDGPAEGTVLSLRRAVIMLRVVRHRKSKKIDALDQLTDIATEDEGIFVYQMVGMPGGAYHICGRDPETGRRTGGIKRDVVFRLLPEQPGDEHTRRNDDWSNWCDENEDRLIEMHKRTIP